MHKLLTVALGLLFLPVPASALKVVNATFISVANGQQTVGPFNVSDNASQMKVSLKRCTSGDLLTWPESTTTIALTLQVSLDDGQTWQTMVGPEIFAGGIRKNGFGVEFAESLIGVSLPAGVGRKGRVLTNVANGPLVSVITIEVN